MKNWDRKKLGDICGFVRGPFGGSLKKNIFKPEGYAVYEQQHAIYDQFDDIRYFIDEKKFNEMKRFELNSGDLIMSCSGTMGKIAIVPENIKKGIINQALLKLTPSKKISTVFLKLWMQSENFQESLKEYSGGAAIQNVASVAILKQIEIPLPTLPEQQRIVSILDEAFAAIAKAKANAEQNLQNAKELFESYLQGVFEKEGDGWEEQLFENCFKLKSGDNLTAKNMTEGEYPVFGGNGIAGYHNEYNLSGSNVIIGRVGALCGNVRHINENIWLTDNAFKVVDFKFDFDHSFLTYLLNHKDLRSYARQAAQPVISNSSLKDVVLFFPKSKNEQQTIVRQLDALRAETQKLEAVYHKKLEELEELKKSVLQKAFNGEL